MKVKIIGLVGALALVFAAAGHAETASVATLTQVQGKVMVNKGKGFVAAKSGMALSDSDRLITLEGSTATVFYGDGCSNVLKANSVLSVSKALGCKAQAVSVNTTVPNEAPIRYAAVGALPGVTLAGGTVISGAVIVGTILGSALILGNTATDDDGISGQ